MKVSNLVGKDQEVGFFLREGEWQVGELISGDNLGWTARLANGFEVTGDYDQNRCYVRASTDSSDDAWNGNVKVGDRVLLELPGHSDEGEVTEVNTDDTVTIDLGDGRTTRLDLDELDEAWLSLHWEDDDNEAEKSSDLTLVDLDGQTVVARNITGGDRDSHTTVGTFRAADGNKFGIEVGGVTLEGYSTDNFEIFVETEPSKLVIGTENTAGSQVFIVEDSEDEYSGEVTGYDQDSNTLTINVAGEDGAPDEQFEFDTRKIALYVLESAQESTR